MPESKNAAKNFGQLAVERMFITEAQLDAAKLQQEDSAKPLSRVLVELGYMTHSQAEAVSALINKEEGWASATQYGQSLIGEEFGGCMILEGIGAGAMGSTFRAHHLRLDREVAIKIMHPRLLRFPGNAERFRTEAQVAARLNHPNIIQIHDFDQRGPFFFMIMQYVKGKDLRELLQENGPFSVRQTIWIASKVLSGLAEAHDHGIVHRDIKPSNILLTQNPSQTYIADFGTVRLMNSSTKESANVFGEILGTPNYMAPEQCMAEEVDPRCDLYSLGISLYELLKGHPPFTANSVMAIMEKQILANVPPFEGEAAVLNDFIAKLTAKSRDERFASSRDALLALHGVFKDVKGERSSVADAPSIGTDPKPKPITAPSPGIPGLIPSTPIELNEIADQIGRSTNMSLMSFEDDDDSRFDEVRPEVNVDAKVQELLSCGELKKRLSLIALEEESDRIIAELLRAMWKAKRVTEILELGPILELSAPHVSASHFVRGLCHAARGEYQEALGFLERARAIAPNYLPGLLHLGQCLQRLNRPVEASDIFREATVMNPDSDVAAVRYAEFLSRVMKDFENAIPAFERAISINPERLDIRRKLGFVLCEVARFDEAEAVALEIVEWSGQEENASDLLAKIVRMRGENMVRLNEQKELAIEEPLPFGEAIAPADSGKTATSDRKESAGVHPRISLMQLAVASGRFDRVRSVYTEGIADAPRSVQLRLAFGKAALDLSEYQTAETIFTEALNLDPTSKDAFRGLRKAQKMGHG